MRKCKFIKSNGKQCNAYPLKGSDYCFMHDPSKKEEKALAVRKGGLAKKRFLLNNKEEIILKDAKDAKNFLSRVIDGVWRGFIPATPVANTLGFLVRCFLDAHEKSDIEIRLDEIERKIERGGEKND